MLGENYAEMTSACTFLKLTKWPNMIIIIASFMQTTYEQTDKASYRGAIVRI